MIPAAARLRPPSGPIRRPPARPSARRDAITAARFRRWRRALRRHRPTR